MVFIVSDTRAYRRIFFSLVVDSDSNNNNNNNKKKLGSEMFMLARVVGEWFVGYSLAIINVNKTNEPKSIVRACKITIARKLG